MEPYRLYYHESVWPVLRRMSAAQQAAVLTLSREIAANPFIEPDYTEADAAGVSWCCTLRSGWAVAYHIDHAVKEVKIGQIRRADT